MRFFFESCPELFPIPRGRCFVFKKKEALVAVFTPTPPPLPARPLLLPARPLPLMHRIKTKTKKKRSEPSKDCLIKCEYKYKMLYSGRE